MLELTKDNFESEVLESPVPVLVDFWASWCGPCKMQAPILKELSEELKGQKIKITKVNIDESQELAQHYHIVSIPTLAIFQNGEIKERFSGLQQKEALRERLEKYF